MMLKISEADHDMAYWGSLRYSVIGEKILLKWFNKAIKLGNENKPHFELDRSSTSPR